MASSPPEIPSEEPSDVKTLIYSYSNRIWRSLLGLFPSPDSSFLAKISNLYPRSQSSRSRSLRSGLPLPLHVNAVRSHLIASEESKAFIVLEDIVEHILSSLHVIHKSLLFWQSLAEVYVTYDVCCDYLMSCQLCVVHMEIVPEVSEVVLLLQGTKTQKVYFMIFRRGPRALVNETCKMLGTLRASGSPIPHVHHSATETISQRISILTSLQCCLANFLAEVYLEVNKYKDVLAEDSEKSLPLLLLAINRLFLKLEASISHPPEIYKSDSSFSKDGEKSCAVVFEKLPDVDEEFSQWTDTEIRDATNMIYQNLQKLDAYISFVLSHSQKPGKLTLYWLRYTCGAVGLSICSAWLLRHSSLTGSSDIDNWIREAKESTAGFWKDHVEQPLLAIRDELFETFRRRHKGVMEVEEVQLTANSLHRMLLAFGEQTKGQKLPENIADQELLEIVMSRYEKEVMHPLQNLLSGELARAMLIQIQKLKLDLETAMLELNQILRANEINFAILAALPAFFLSLLLLMLVRTWILQDKGAEGKGRIARLQRRLLVVEVEKRIMQFQTCIDQGLVEESKCMFGLLLYSLDRLFKAVERNAKETGEWLSLRQDIVDLAKPELKTEYKLAVTSRLGRMYDCLLPSSKPR